MVKHQTRKDGALGPRVLWLYAGTCLLFISSLIAVFWSWNQGGATLQLTQAHFWGAEWTLGITLDVISGTLLLMVTLLGAVIGHYSLRYLHGEKKQPYFYRYLFLTILSVSLLVTSSNLAVLYLMWLATSFSLHRLLVYFSERPQALMAAKKKFIISRIGDVFLLLGIAITFREFGTLELKQLFEIVKSASYSDSSNFGVMSLVGCLFAIGAMTKSVQLPFHFWLPETMETPTPVSALMHAGVINAGGFLMIRVAPLLEQADVAHLLLTVVGAATAVFGSLVMITQNDIKKKLAYSTISQMGMMIFACGIGAYSVALFHIVAHSFYKAHAFLSTGALVAESKKIGFKLERPSNAMLMTISLVGLSLLLSGAVFEGGKYFIYFTYVAVLLLGICQNFGRARTEIYSKARVVLSVGSILLVAVGIVFFVEHSLQTFLTGLVPDGEGSWARGQTNLVIALSCYLIFLSGLWLSAHLINPENPFIKKIYVYLWNGGYFSTGSSEMLASSMPSNQIAKQGNVKSL